MFGKSQEVDLELFKKTIFRILFYHLFHVKQACALANFLCCWSDHEDVILGLCHRGVQLPWGGALGPQRRFGWDACVVWHLDPGFPSRTLHCNLMFYDIHFTCQWVQCCGSTACIVSALVSVFIKLVPRQESLLHVSSWFKLLWTLFAQIEFMQLWVSNSSVLHLNILTPELLMCHGWLSANASLSLSNCLVSHWE